MASALWQMEKSFHFNCEFVSAQQREWRFFSVWKGTKNHQHELCESFRKNDTELEWGAHTENEREYSNNPIKINKYLCWFNYLLNGTRNSCLKNKKSMYSFSTLEPNASSKRERNHFMPSMPLPLLSLEAQRKYRRRRRKKSKWKKFCVRKGWKSKVMFFLEENSCTNKKICNSIKARWDNVWMLQCVCVYVCTYADETSTTQEFFECSIWQWFCRKKKVFEVLFMYKREHKLRKGKNVLFILP